MSVHSLSLQLEYITLRRRLQANEVNTDKEVVRLRAEVQQEREKNGSLDTVRLAAVSHGVLQLAVCAGVCGLPQAQLTAPSSGERDQPQTQASGLRPHTLLHHLGACLLLSYPRAFIADSGQKSWTIIRRFDRN